MLLKQGDKLLVAHRRLFETDVARFFIGQVDDYESDIIKVTGYSFMRDVMSGQMIKKNETRTKILSLSAGTLIIYLLPEQTSLDTLNLVVEDSNLLVKADTGFHMNLTEYLPAGRGNS